MHALISVGAPLFTCVQLCLLGFGYFYPASTGLSQGIESLLEAEGAGVDGGAWGWGWGVLRHTRRKYLFDWPVAFTKG